MKLLLDSLTVLLCALSAGAGCSARGGVSIGAPAPEHPEHPEADELAVPGDDEPAVETSEAVAQEPADAEPADASGLRSARSTSGHYTVSWRPLASEVPNNEPFELEFFLEKDGVPARGAQVVVRGWMPEHGHGMVRRPEVEDRGDGSYLVRGMLLHMSGLWELFFDVYEPGARKDRVRFEIRL